MCKLYICLIILIEYLKVTSNKCVLTPLGTAFVPAVAGVPNVITSLIYFCGGQTGGTSVI